MPNVVVISDMVAWREWDEKRRKDVYHYHQRKGPEPLIVDMPEHEIIRHEDLAVAYPGDPRFGLPHVVREEDHEAWAADRKVTIDPVWAQSDDQLMALTADGLFAQLNQVPGLAARVLDLEKSRKYTRKAVVEHCERLIEAARGGDVSLVEKPETLPVSPLTESRG
jgi:hypothetical protein